MASGAARRPGARQGDPNVVALLSLKLILLGFFILLNALSEYEESRTRMVLESVNEAFNGRVDALVAALARCFGPTDSEGRCDAGSSGIAAESAVFLPN